MAPARSLIRAHDTTRMISRCRRLSLFAVFLPAPGPAVQRILLPDRQHSQSRRAPYRLVFCLCRGTHPLPVLAKPRL